MYDGVGGERERRADRRLVLAVLSLANSLVVLDGLIVAVALPAIQDAMGFDAAGLQWVVNAYVLCFGGFLLLGGRLADLLGRRRVAVGGLLVFAAGSLVAGLAPSAGLLVAGRALQGVGAATLDPALLALLITTFREGRERDRALGIWSAAGSLGIPAGALLGGLLTGVLGWRWVLLATAPVAVAAAGLLVAWVGESRDRTGPRRLDLPGAVTATAGLAVAIFAITGGERLAHGPAGPGALLGVGVPLAAAALLLAGFVAVERRHPAPLVPFSIFGTPGLRAANLAGAALPVGLGALMFLGTLYLQRVLGLGPVQTGVAYLALSLPVVAASPAASLLVARFGRRPVAVGGLLVQAAGLGLMLRISPDGSFLGQVLPGFLLVGAGAPIAWVPLTAAAVDGAGQRSGIASGIFNTAQQVGNALALAVLATVAAGRTSSLLGDAGGSGHGDPVALVGGLQAGFLAAALLCLLGAAAALRLPGPAAGEDGGPRGQDAGDARQDQDRAGAELARHPPAEQAAGRTGAEQHQAEQAHHPAAHGRVGAELDGRVGGGHEGQAGHADGEQHHGRDQHGGGGRGGERQHPEGGHRPDQQQPGRAAAAGHGQGADH